MTRVSIHNVGAIGVVKDLPPHTLPPEAWSAASNVRFQDNKAIKFKGFEDVLGAPSAAPYWAMNVVDQTTAFWIYASLTKLYATDGTTHAEITRTVGGDYSTTADQLWHGGVLGGLPVITNGVDDPQAWASLSLASDMADLANWPANYVCQVIRPFKNFLVALDITKSGTRYPHTVLWSHPADPGSLPSSWDTADATKDAGEFELNDSNAGIIKDGLALGDLFFIYKEQSVWALQFVGGQFVFRNLPIFQGLGILTAGCVTTFDQGRQHFACNGERLYVHQGSSPTFLGDRRTHKFLQANLDETNAMRSFCVANPREHEVWFCFPENGATYPSMALVWNSRDNVIGVKELDPEVPHIAVGFGTEGSGDSTWDSDSGTWNSDTTTWDERLFVGHILGLVQSNVTDTKLQRLDMTNQEAGTNMTATLERTGLAISGRDRQGQPKVDFGIRKLVTRVWPKIDASGPINVYVGSQEKEKDAVTYSAALPFDPSTDEFVDCCAEGRLIAIKFESTTDVSWELEGYDIEVVPLGVH